MSKLTDDIKLLEESIHKLIDIKISLVYKQDLEFELKIRKEEGHINDIKKKLSDENAYIKKLKDEIIDTLSSHEF